MRKLLLAIVLVGPAGLAGCLGTGDTELAANEAAGGDGFQAPPDLQVGDWWTIQTDGPTDVETYETTVVVAERTPESLTLGVPPDEFADRMQILHLPPLGHLDAGTLSWYVMLDRFQPVTFPLEPGQEWTTQFHGNEVDAEVVETADGTARVDMIGDNERIEVTYDAEVGMVTSFDPETYPVGFEVTDHGTGYEGELVAPVDKDLGFLTFRLAGAAGPGLEPAPPVETFDVDQEASHASLALFATPAPGVYRGSVTAPDGTTFEEVFTRGPDASAVEATFFGHESPQGTWEVELESAGAGAIGAELITYDLVEVTLGSDRASGDR